jgi:hypothetical protein
MTTTSARTTTTTTRATRLVQQQERAAASCRTIGSLRGPSWRQQWRSLLLLSSPLATVVAKILVLINFVYLVANLVGHSISMTAMETSRLILSISHSSNSLISDTLLSSKTVGDDAPSIQHSSLSSSSTAARTLFHGQPFKDVLCVGCREMVASSKGITCGRLIYEELLAQNQSQNLVTATETVLNTLGGAAAGDDTKNAECFKCRPDACTETEKVYWRLDDAGPRVLQGTALFLPSIPTIHRVPDPNVVNLTCFFSNASHVHPAASYFFEYNPSIVQIPSRQIPRHVLTEREANETVYLASFRVTNRQQCIQGDDQLAMMGGDWSARPKFVDYLGLALLRNDLSIVADVVLDNKKKYSAMKDMQDYRLFLLNEQLYVASFHQIIPIWFIPPPTKSNESNDDTPIVLVENRFPSKLNVYTRSYTSCLEKGADIIYFKNINYFVDDQRNETIAELLPMKMKQVVNLTRRCTTRPSNVAKSQVPRTREGHTQARIIQSNVSLPILSFGSYDQIHFFNHGAFRTVSGERGSACCVRIRDPAKTTTTTTTESSLQSQQLLLGISHSKTVFRNKKTRNSLAGNVSASHFFSTFYAMEPVEPFTVRARSGRFCLGFPTVNETTGGNDSGGRRRNPYGRSNMGKLRLGGDHYDCPYIHFVSGMVEKANDASKVVIAYGVQDCVPRFIDVDKENILQMLFPHHTVHVAVSS